MPLLLGISVSGPTRPGTVTPGQTPVMHYDAHIVQQDESLSAAIGLRIRQQRQERSWTLDQLCESAGLSRRMLINIEQGAANPSVGTLLKLSEALGVGLPTLVEPPAPRIKTTRAGEGSVLWHGENGGRGTLLAHTKGTDVVELWDWTMHPGDVHSSEAHTPGTQELLHVLDGAIRVEADGEPHTLQTGDALSFPGDVPHSYAHVEGSPARFALTVFEPAGRSSH